MVLFPKRKEVPCRNSTIQSIAGIISSFHFPSRCTTVQTDCSRSRLHQPGEVLMILQHRCLLGVLLDLRTHSCWYFCIDTAEHARALGCQNKWSRFFVRILLLCFPNMQEAAWVAHRPWYWLQCRTYTKQEEHLLEGDKHQLSRAYADKIFEVKGKSVVKTELTGQVMKLGFANLAKKISLTWMSKLTKDESH